MLVGQLGHTVWMPDPVGCAGGCQWPLVHWVQAAYECAKRKGRRVSIAELSSSYTGSSDGPPDDRLPPQDLGAEQSVLGSMLLNKDAIADCLEVVEVHGLLPSRHELIYDAVLELYGRGEPADAITVADELNKRGDLTRVGGQAYLHQLIQSVPTAANAGYYAEIVHERAILRRLVEAGTRIVQMGYGQGEGDVDEIVNRAQAEVYSVAEKRGGEDYHQLGELLNATMEEIEAAAGRTDDMTGMPTGFLELDNLTNGLHPGQMIVIAADPPSENRPWESTSPARRRSSTTWRRRCSRSK